MSRYIVKYLDIYGNTGTIMLYAETLNAAKDAVLSRPETAYVEWAARLK